MKIIRLLAAALLAAATCASAQNVFPAKPIRLIVPFPPAGGTDTLSRAIAHAMQSNAQWTIVVDNKPGAGGNIGLDATAKSPPDGYTIAMGQTANLAVNPALYASMPYDPLKDFAPIALISSQPLILVVNTSSPYKSLKDLVDASKASPGKINMASSSNGTIGHIGGELFQRRAGIKMTHVPYKGAGAAVTDLMGGSVDCFFGNTQAVGGLVTGGKLRPLAVTSPRRLANFPDVPTVAELGYPGFEAATWSGLLAPAGTHPRIVARLNLEANRALGTDPMKQKLHEDGSTPLGGTPEQFAEFIRNEHAKWGAAVREAGIKLD
ncbi:MAG TPA: tripartite tricarboxylate transporter substrate binding protein [Usitatibacter sp.]|jgi:tripartite-type tricarboxylate transporter receptor subunit TctC|nr:tripartite tricarboxylate transporter substrate binding protein [Usitatibacter sp.]